MTAVVAAGAGELLTDEEHRQVQVKADRDELAVTESRTPRARAARTSIPTVSTATASSCSTDDSYSSSTASGQRPPLAISSRCRHWSSTPSATRAPATPRFFNLHAPSKGFIQHLRDGGDPDRFDTFNPSER